MSLNVLTIPPTKPFKFRQSGKSKTSSNFSSDLIKHFCTLKLFFIHHLKKDIIFKAPKTRRWCGKIKWMLPSILLHTCTLTISNQKGQVLAFKASRHLHNAFGAKRNSLDKFLSNKFRHKTVDTWIVKSLIIHDHFSKQEATRSKNEIKIQVHNQTTWSLLNVINFMFKRYLLILNHFYLLVL